MSWRRAISAVFKPYIVDDAWFGRLRHQRGGLAEPPTELMLAAPGERALGGVRHRACFARIQSDPGLIEAARLFLKTEIKAGGGRLTRTPEQAFSLVSLSIPDWELSFAAAADRDGHPFLVQMRGTAPRDRTMDG